MAEKNFNSSLQNVLVYEGGYVNHPKDPGGATNRGVTQCVYDRYRSDEGLAERSVKGISDDEVREIYRSRYWGAAGCGTLPEGVDLFVFDGAVNSGPVQSVKWLQRALGTRYVGKIDGIVGPSTMAAIAVHPDHDLLIADMAARRMAFLQALGTWGTFGKGWTARVNNARAVSQAWATGSIGPKPEYDEAGAAKAPIEAAEKAPSAVIGDVAASGGVTGAIISQAIAQLAPYGSLEIVAHVIAGLTVVGVTLMLGGVAWRAWANVQQEKRADALDLVTA